jgi:hyaluronan synthase
VVLAMLALRRGRPTDPVDVLWGIAFVWLVARLALAWLWRPARLFPAEHTRKAVAGMRVGAVIPAYNERLRSLDRTLRSLEVQTRRPDFVYIVDDGSASREHVAALLFEATRSHLDVRVMPVAANGGKRFAQARAWLDEARCDVWVLVDSDTTFAPDALAEILATFVDPRVHAATSLILPRNRGLLARLQEVEYATSQLSTRLVFNWLHAVPVISGGCCAVRDHVIRDNLTEYLKGYSGVHIGDDRHLALMANLTGRVVVAHRARSYTAVPTRLWPLVRQRVRWCRGFFLGAAWTARHAKLDDRVWWVMLYSVLNTAVAFGILAYLVTGGVQVTAPGYAASVAVLAWVRSWRYLAEDHPMPGRQYLSWLLAPASVVFGLVVLVPVQVYALLTCRRGGWLTR